MSQRNSERGFKRRKGNNKNKQTIYIRSNECYNCCLPGHFARDCPSEGSRKSRKTAIKPRPSPYEIEEDQLKTLSDNFNSAELSYGGSDKIVFAPLEDELKNAWKRFIKKELIHQHKMRKFITSCLIAIDKHKGDEVEELVTELGKTEGLKRIREIVMFPMSVDAGLVAKVASFQRVILPFMALLTRSGITECIVEKYVHPIFYAVYLNLDSFMHDGVITMLEILVQRNDIVDKKVDQSKLLEDDAIAFIPSSLCNVFIKRIKEASTNETMYKIVTKIEQAKKLWQDNLQQDIGNTYDEPLASNIARREYFFTILDREIDSMNKMLNYRQPNLSSQEIQRISYTNPNKPALYYRKLAKRVALMLDYDPPGELSNNGKRHDNDFVEISKISIIPTKEEILCDRDPFLPTTNIDDTLHYLPKGARRLFDTQFRLLREDMMCPIRLGIENFIKFISESAKNKAKIKKLQEHGGRHKYENKEGMDGGDLNVYANVHFSDVKVDQKRGFSCRMGFTQPPMRRNSGNRQQYWNKSGKLMNGSLVCLLWPSENRSPNNDLQFSLFFGTVSSRDEKLLSRDQHIALIDISFIDSLIYQLALNEIKKKNSGGSNEPTTRCFMVESTGVYFESYFHILKALQTKLPSSLPFEKYLAPQITENSFFAAVDPPIYARAPQFVFDLSILLNDKNKRLFLNVADRFSHENVIRNLQKSSKLDNTQAKSLVYSLCREVALIEGPPGTGKTFVGVEIMKVLMANKKYTNIGPILTICFTNHALDQFLENLLNAGIKKIVRLGRRSKSEIIQNFNIEELCKSRPRSRVQRSMLSEGYDELRRIEKEAEELLSGFSLRWLNWDEIADYFDLDIAQKWTQTKKTKRNMKAKANVNKFDALRHLNNKEDTKNIEKIKDSKDFENFKRNRSLKDLKTDPNVWQMSKDERIKLHDFWKESVQSEYIVKLVEIKGKYEKKKKDIDKIYDEIRRQILSDCDVIGMTTNGAAKFQTLISSIGPRIIICEEAGEVLEAHILSALTSKTQQMILIGDHNQLRPHCATYTLTCDSKIGVNYALDKSLFERLVNGDQAMRLEKSQLCTQRRMRREISDLIRHTLYKELVDDENSVGYPDVRGAQRNVYFMDHRCSEDSSENDFAMNSHSNTFEVKMVIGLVRHFVHNGYNKPGQIAVLTPYLGQLIKVRDMLSKSFVVVIDERDDQLITDMEESIDAENKNRNDESTSSIEKINTVTTERKKLSQQVILRTVDNFQGEEADIVIISLVRNTRKGNDRGNIGFLKSANRSNVLLSHLMGRHSDFWRNVVGILRKRGQVGPGFPIVCSRHPNYKNNIFEASQFDEISPDGGCFEPCRQQLKCGHICPYKCHSYDMQHIGVRCQKDCTRLHPDCQHPCNKICGEDCGDCSWPIGNITLPCGHEYKNAKCHYIKNINKVLCQEKLLRKLPNCEHEHLIKCHMSIYYFKCTERCSKLLPCEHPCMSACSECQDLSKGIDQNPRLDSMGQIIRSNHGKCEQKCESLSLCQRKVIYVKKDVMRVGRANLAKVPVMFLACIRNANKSVRNLVQSVRKHKDACKLPCGVPCNRLPCELRCEKLLECGHQCFGLCGEKCPPPKYCAECTTDENVKNQVVDLIMQESFAEVDWTSKRMIVLACGHVYTADSLDHLMEMKKYYEIDLNYQWIGLKTITSQPNDPKSCPQCRAPIKNICRYGRAIKKNVLDIQNQKFLVKYDNQLKKLNEDIKNATKQLENKRAEFFKKIQIPLKAKEMNKIEKNSALQIIPEVISTEQYTLLEKYSIPLVQKKRWKQHISVLLAIYRKLIQLIKEIKFPPYKRAYETAVSLLYASKTRFNISDLEKNFKYLDNYDHHICQNLKLQETLAEVGLTAPKMDVRMYLDAFLEIVNIQKVIFHEISLIIQELSKMAGPANKTNQTYEKNWIEFGKHIIETIKTHLDTIITTAQQNSYLRHEILTYLELVEVE
ncbi:4995_t:CDS:10, partial [Gigaspora margarita]